MRKTWAAALALFALNAYITLRLAGRCESG